MSHRSTAIGLLAASGLAVGPACLHPASNPAPDAGVCALGGTGFAAGEPDPQNPCRSCQPLLSNSLFSPLAEGTPCGSDASAFRHLGGCRSGCFIEGSFHTPGESAPDRTCQTCDPAQSLTAWSSLTGAAPPGTCGGAEVCSQGACITGCFIGGGAFLDGVSNPENLCESCNAEASTSIWSELPAGSGCGDGGQCSTGHCTYGCSIGEALYPPNAPDPSDPCRSCQPAHSFTDFSPFSGVPSSPCAGGQICDHGICASGCWIDGDLVTPGTLASNPPCAVCLPDQNAQAFSPFSGDSLGTCGPGEVCQSGACLSGCFIDGGYLAPGTFQNGTAALCCGPTTNTSAWTTALLPGKAYAALGGDMLLAGDIDGDGITDLVSAGFYASIEVFFGDGNGGLRTPSLRPSLVVAGWTISGGPMALGDLNGDGLLDLVLGTSVDGGNVLGVSFFGDGGFGNPVASTFGNPISVAVADFNGDGHPDVAASNTGGVQIFLNQGDGSLTPGPFLSIGAISYARIAAGDFDGDGAADLLATPGELLFWFGDGVGGFPNSATAWGAGFISCTAVGSLDGSGGLDILTGSEDYQMLQQARVGANRHIQVAGYAMPELTSVALIDLNGDRRPDVLASADSSGAGDLEIMLNTAEGLLPRHSLQINAPSGYYPQTYVLTTGNFAFDAGTEVAVLSHYGGTDAGLVIYQPGCQ